LNGKKMSGVELIDRLNEIGGANGVGRLDLVENRLVGLSRAKSMKHLQQRFSTLLTVNSNGWCSTKTLRISRRSLRATMQTSFITVSGSPRCALHGCICE